MNNRAPLFKELIRESLYVVDEHAVADAIVLRATARRVIPELPFCSLSARSPGFAFARDGLTRSFRVQ